jgi:nucleoside-diphosphate-sugar epimerase
MNLSFYEDKKVLVTGASGYIGSMLSQKLANIECSLLLHSHKNKLKISNPKANIEQFTGNISPLGSWDKLVLDVDVIFHLAEHHYNTFDPEKDLSITAQPVLSLLETLRNQNNKPQIVFASSSNLVGYVSTLPVNENFSDNPLTIYAIHKKLAEYYLEYYFREFGIPSITLRLANVYGPSQDREITKRAVLNLIIDRALSGGSVKLFSNKDKIRDFVYIDDVVEAFLLAGSETGDGNYYLIGSEERQTFKNAVYFISESIKKKNGKKLEILFDNETVISDIEKREFVADVSKFTNLTGWKPKVSLAEGIDKTLDFFSRD